MKLQKSLFSFSFFAIVNGFGQLQKLPNENYVITGESCGTINPIKYLDEIPENLVDHTCSIIQLKPSVVSKNSEMAQTIAASIRPTVPTTLASPTTPSTTSTTIASSTTTIEPDTPCPAYLAPLAENAQCDDEVNIPDCLFDNGACCGPNVDTTYCFECECKHPGIDCESDTCKCSWLGDGECDDANNTPECLFDKGDCCLDPLAKGVCTDCLCITTTTTTTTTTISKLSTTGSLTPEEMVKADGFDYSGCLWYPGPPWYWYDGVCDSNTNTAACNWDGGDCGVTETQSLTPEEMVQADGFDYSGCLWYPGPPWYWYDGVCDSNTNTAACNFDGGDCA